MANRILSFKHLCVFHVWRDAQNQIIRRKTERQPFRPRNPKFKILLHKNHKRALLIICVTLY